MLFWLCLENVNGGIVVYNIIFGYVKNILIG